MLIRFFQRTWLKMILLNLAVLFFMFYKKLNGRMGRLCSVSDKKAKQGQRRSGPNPVREAIPSDLGGIWSGRTDNLSVMKKQYMCKTNVGLVECNLFRNNVRCPTLEMLCSSLCCPLAKSLDIPANHLLYGLFCEMFNYGQRSTTSYWNRVITLFMRDL